MNVEYRRVEGTALVAVLRVLAIFPLPGIVPQVALREARTAIAEKAPCRGVLRLIISKQALVWPEIDIQPRARVVAGVMRVDLGRVAERRLHGHPALEGNIMPINSTYFRT